MAVVETDKGAIDVEIFIDGVVRELLVQPGTRVPVGTALALLDTEAAVPPARPSGGRSRRDGAALPSASRSRHGAASADIARCAQARLELHVDAASLRGTGPEGAITVADVERAAPAPLSQAIERTAPQPSPARLGEGAAGMRAAIAAAMSRSKREIPHYYLATNVDVTPASDWLAAHNARCR